MQPGFWYQRGGELTSERVSTHHHAHKFTKNVALPLAVPSDSRHRRWPRIKLANKWLTHLGRISQLSRVFLLRSQGPGTTCLPTRPWRGSPPCSPYMTHKPNITPYRHTRGGRIDNMRSRYWRLCFTHSSSLSTRTRARSFLEGLGGCNAKPPRRNLWPAFGTCSRAPIHGTCAHKAPDAFNICDASNSGTPLIIFVGPPPPSSIGRHAPDTSWPPMPLLPPQTCAGSFKHDEMNISRDNDRPPRPHNTRADTPAKTRRCTCEALNRRGVRRRSLCAFRRQRFIADLAWRDAGPTAMPKARPCAEAASRRPAGRGGCGDDPLTDYDCVRKSIASPDMAYTPTDGRPWSPTPPPQHLWPCLQTVTIRSSAFRPPPIPFVPRFLAAHGTWSLIFIVFWPHGYRPALFCSLFTRPCCAALEGYPKSPRNAHNPRHPAKYRLRTSGRSFTASRSTGGGMINTRDTTSFKTLTTASPR